MISPDSRRSDQDYFIFDLEIHKIARFLCREHPSVEFQDIKQDLWEVLLFAQSKGKLTEVDDRYLRSTLRLKGLEICGNYRRQHLTISPQYGYRTKDVRKLLETFFDRESWPTAEIPEDALSELGDVGVEMSCDLSRAWDKLPDKSKVLLYRAFATSEEMEEKERKRLSDVIQRMADVINEYQGRTKTVGREAKTRAQEQHIIDWGLNGNYTSSDVSEFEPGRNG